MCKPPQISIGEAVRRFRLSADTLKRWARRGHIRCWRDPVGRRLFDPEEIAARLRPVEERQPGATPRHRDAVDGAPATVQEGGAL